MSTVTYATFCCEKDRERALEHYLAHVESHKHEFDQNIMIFQRCKSEDLAPGWEKGEIWAAAYEPLLKRFGIKWPDEVLDHLTHGWDAPHFWAHHVVNHLCATHLATSEYIVFSDADCYMRDTPEAGPSWVEEGIKILESNPRAFVISPNDGGDARPERIMSQQMFLIRREDLLNMTFIPWDGKFIDGGPFQEYYGLLEGWIGRFMEKQGLYRVVLPAAWRYWHKEWH